jgi:hypothetical protein
MALPYPIYGVDRLYLFPVYSSRAAYEKEFGVEPPPYNPGCARKNWFDPKAAESTRRYVTYDRAFALTDRGTIIKDEKGQPVLEPLVLNKDEAATANIPPDRGFDDAWAAPSVPVPMRALETGEELAYDIAGNVVVRNRELHEATLDPGFTNADRRLLREIAKKLGVEAA